MFHIKTDIRQYKCKTTAKVERLIRNWVIRPSDLIYNAKEKTWNPIGQHPAFNDIFAVIEQEEANEPDTIVTEAPSEIAAEHEVEPGAELEDELEADGAGLHADSEEITNVRPAPSGPKGEAATEDAPPAVLEPEKDSLSADSEEITNVTDAPEQPSDEAEVDEEETTDVREDPRATDEEDAVAPPEAPEGVEGLIRDSDEITMMTDKTFEMMRKEANGGAEAVAEEEASPEEPTQLVDREELFDEDESEDDAEAVEEEAEASAEDADEPAKEESGKEESGKEESGKGRHGLPEEVFVTDEIPRQDVQQAVLDELGELEEDGDEEEADDEVTEVVNEEDRKPRWRIVMSDDLDSKAQIEAADEAESIEEDAEPAEVEEDPADEADDKTSLEEESDEDLDEMLDEAAELVGLSEESDPVDIDGADIEPIEDDGRERAETPVKQVDVEEFVSEGYKLPLPVDISPTAEDIRLGLEHSRVSRKVKDAVFPYPKPKRKGEVATRVFDLDPEEPRDHSLVIVAAFVVGFLLLLVGAVTFFG